MNEREGTYSAAEAAIQHTAMIHDRMGSTALKASRWIDPVPTCFPLLHTELNDFQGPSPGSGRVVGRPAISRQSMIIPAIALERTWK